MIAGGQVAETFAGLLSQPQGDVVGLVDRLLSLCAKHDLELDIGAEWSRVRAIGGEWEEIKTPALPRSVLRAVLARVATLCNERGHAMSPYGGEAELLVSDGPRNMFHVVLCNTPAVQRLELTRPADGTANGRSG